jgi:hypothetical protein
MANKHLLLYTTAILLVSVAPSAFGGTWRVELDGSGHFLTIQDAVNAAAAGDTIRIGPGRFETFHEIGLPGYTDEVIVHVTKPNLVFIGAGKDVTRIGTTINHVPYGLAPRVFFSLAPNNFVLQEMTIENVYVLVLSNADVTAQRCAFAGGDYRITCVHLQGSVGRFEDCDVLLSAGGKGIVFTGGTHDSVVRNCRFNGAVSSDAVNCSFGPQNIAISDCMVQNGRFTFYDATGTIARCVLTSTYSTALQIANPTSFVSITDVVVNGAPYGLAVLNSRCTAVRLSLLGTTSGAIMTTGRSEVVIHDSSIVPLAGWAVFCDVAPSWPSHTLDLTGNNWGVTDASSIAAMIWDNRDDPRNPCTVLYEPYVGQPVPVEFTTWGDLKSKYR